MSAARLLELLTLTTPADDLENEFAELEAGAEEWFSAERIPDSQRELTREADMKFVGQIFEVTTTLPPGPFSEADKEGLRTQFVKDYESEFGTGTAWTEAELLLVNSRVRAVGHSEVQSSSMADGGSSRAASDFSRTILE